MVEGPGLEDVISGFEIVVHPDAAAAAGAAAPHEEEALSFSKEQQWRVPFGTAFARQQTVVPALVVPGEIVAPPGALAEIGAPVAGRLLAPRGGCLVREPS